MREPGFETLCAHFGEDPTRYAGAAVPPLYQNSLFTSPDTDAFLHRTARHPEVYDYTRVANPTTDILEAKLAVLERMEAARCFGSGMAAVSGAILHGVRSGDHVIAVDSVYGPARMFLSDYLARFEVSVTYVPGTDPQQFADALRPNTRLFYLESPSSLIFQIQDLRAVCTLARERGILTVMDNSWASPYFQNPAEFGVDLVLHSATKYLGGHSDLVAGVVMGSAAAIKSLRCDEGCLLGGVLDPFAAWLMLRGLRTLPIRLERHQQNALAVAHFLEAHPRVARVFYPGLPSHPQYALAQSQMRGSSGLFSFALKDGDRAAACAFVDRLRYFGIAVSWGGYESLAIPSTLPQDPGESPAVPGVMAMGGKFVWGARLHIGLETVEDLLEDLESALESS